MTISPPSFYRAFEDCYRGSRDLIKSRLRVYLPFILPLKECYSGSQGIDLGCGRGEWLELMRENGVEVQGVDLDHGMLEAARERGLNVNQGDAIQSLQSLAPDSQVLVSGFHLAEHLSFELLQSLIRESLRVLKPGGLLILEAPNPENIMVGTWSFYMDPTHQKPLPPQLLSFMVGYWGFKRVKVLRLQESPELAADSTVTLISVLNGASPDFAVVAQKEGGADITAATARAFEIEYGLSLESLANRYDQQTKAALEAKEVERQQIEVALWAKEVERQQVQATVWAKEVERQQSELALGAKEVERQKIEEALRVKEAELSQIQNSKYWRFGKPIRALVNSIIRTFKR